MSEELNDWIHGEPEAGGEEGWIPWHGGECPVHPDDYVETKLRYGDYDDYARNVTWSHGPDDHDVMEYRVLKTHDGWTPHYGGECPIEPDLKVAAALRSDPDRENWDSNAGRAGTFRWSHLGDGSDILYYKVVS